MDQLALVVPDGLEVEAGEAVTLLGRDGDERVGAEELGRLAGTIGYEIVCGLRHRPGRGERAWSS
jgi:alanine racemase